MRRRYDRATAPSRAAQAVALGFLLAAPAAAMAQETPPGKGTYDRWCAGCHGEDGKGVGPAAVAMLPRPRDFTSALYQIRTTPSGALPTDADIQRMIDDGMPGTAMPGWKENLSDEDRSALVQYVKSFSAFFERQEAPEPVEIGGAPGESEEGLAEGRELYQKIECWKCHGEAGRGDGSSAPTLEDDEGVPIRAADLTKGWNFNGGATTEQIFTRLMTGLNGTPMPSFADLIEADVVTEEGLWRIAQYVHSLSPEKPETSEVIRAALVEAGVPASPADSAWQRIEPSYVPLVGQVIVDPRWFVPTVDGVWVRALYDGEELALLLSWHDPSKSPDPEWNEWEAKVQAAVSQQAPAADTTAASGAAAAAGGLGDSFVVQFPTSIPDGMERPYFLMGSERDPVYLWLWTSEAEGAREAVARGLDRIEPLAGEAILAAQATFDRGEWRLLVRRPLAAREAEDRLHFEAGRAIPVAFFAWDGSNGESGTRGSISTWYFLYLDQPTARSVYVLPLAAMLLTAALGVVMVVRVQRRYAGGAPDRKSD